MPYFSNVNFLFVNINTYFTIDTQIQNLISKVHLFLMLSSDLLNYIDSGNLPPNLVHTIRKGPNYSYSPSTNVDYVDYVDFTNYPLFWSIRNDDILLLSLLVKSGFTDNNEQYNYDNAYLIVDAIYFNNLKALTFLYFCRPNLFDCVPDFEIKFAYDYAVKNNLIDVVKFLKTNIPSIVEKSSDGRTPFYTVQTLEDINELLLSGININSRDNEGYTAFHVQCINNASNNVLLGLLAAGADPNILMPNGKSIWFYVGSKKISELGLSKKIFSHS